MSQDDPQPDPKDDPPAAKPQALQYFTNTPDTRRLVTLCKLGSMEAQLAHAKLESEGIQCFILDQNIALNHPFVFTTVRLQVAESDVEIAREILNQPADIDDDGEYADEPFRCPRCHRKKVDLVPLRGWKRAALWTWIGLIALPLLPLSVPWIVPDERFISWVRATSESLWVGWLLTVGMLGLFVLGSKRRKSCRECGLIWKDGDSQEAE